MNKNDSTRNERLWKKGKNIKLFISILVVIIVAIGLFFMMNKNDTIDHSTIDGVSDEVYKQLVEQYFFVTKNTEMSIDFVERGVKHETKWIEEHELFEQADDYVEDHDDLHMPTQVFPNPLRYEYIKDPNSFSETEQAYIEKIEDYIETMQRVDIEEFERLKKELNSKLDIKDSYNPFDE